MGIWSRIAEVTEQARVDWVAEVEDERAPRLERVGEELARGHLVFDVVRAAPALRGQSADDLPVGCRTAIHVHDRQKILGVLVDVPGPDKEVGAAIGFPVRRHRRTAARSQEEQANRMPAKSHCHQVDSLSGFWDSSTSFLQITQPCRARLPRAGAEHRSHANVPNDGRSPQR